MSSSVGLPQVSATAILTAQLEPLGPWPPARPPLSGAPEAHALELSNDGRVETGVWECTPGAFTSAVVGYCELMHFVAGDATITGDDGVVHAIAPGALLFFPDGWRGRWEIRETVRKSYAIIQAAD